MLTPKQLRRLGEILSRETSELQPSGRLRPLPKIQGLESLISPSLKDYVEAALSEKPYSFGAFVRVSPAGKIEALLPSDSLPWARRLASRALVRILVSCAREGFPLSFPAREWLAGALRAEDFRHEAGRVHRPYFEMG